MEAGTPQALPPFASTVTPLVTTRDVKKASMPKLASTSNLWPWPQPFGLGLASVCSRRNSKAVC